MKRLIGTITKILMFFFGWAILISIGVFIFPSDNPAIWRFWAEFIPFIIIILFSILFWFIEKRSFPLMEWNNPLKNILLGIIVGAFWIGIPIVALYVGNVITFEGTNKIAMPLLWGISCLLNVIMQELLVRGYIYQLIKHKYTLTAAIIVTTVIFTVLHAGAFEEGIIPDLCVVTMSLAMSVVMEYTESLLAPILMHFIWNCVGALIFNVVMLADDYPHYFNSVFSGHRILTGGSCFIEGSIVVLVVNLVLFDIFIFMLRKKHKS